jgi:hypothetical protein
MGCEGLAGTRSRSAVTLETDVLAAVVRELETLGIPYMVTGSFASSIHGKPRTTHDADIVIDPTPGTLERLVATLSAAGLYVDAGVAADALRRRRQFNVIDTATAFKVDLIICKDRRFSREELARRQRADVGGIPAALATPEDTILSKLEWAKASGSTRQIEDARGVVEVKGPDLDCAYVERWARELGVLDLWLRIAP